MNLLTHFRVVTAATTLIYLTLLCSNCSCQLKNTAEIKNFNHNQSNNKHRDNNEPLSLAKSSSRVKSEFVAVESSNVHFFGPPSNLHDAQLDTAESHHGHSKHSKHHKHHQNGKHEGE